MADGFLWRHRTLLEDDETATYAKGRGADLHAGDTPLTDASALAAELGLRSLWIKREDHNPSHSHKDRGLLYQVAAHRRAGATSFVLSSSGNAAVAAARACAAHGSQLIAFVHPGTAPAKLGRLLLSSCVVVETLRPSNFARYAHRVFGLPDLRGTRDPLAPRGYRSLAAELVEGAPEAEAVLTFNSSGISMEGLIEGFVLLRRRPRLFAVQAGECIALARVLDPTVTVEPRHPAGRLGVKNPPDAQRIAMDLQASGGGAVVASLAGTERWTRRLADEGLDVGPEGAAVFAALDDLAQGPLRGASVVAVMTGGPEQERSLDPATSPREPHRLSSYLELRDLLIDLGVQPLPGVIVGDLQ